MRFHKTEIAQVVEGVSMAPSNLSTVLSNPNIMIGFEAEFNLTDKFDDVLKESADKLDFGNFGEDEITKGKLKDVLSDGSVFVSLVRTDVVTSIQSNMYGSKGYSFGFTLFGRALRALGTLQDRIGYGAINFPLKNRKGTWDSLVAQCSKQGYQELQAMIAEGAEGAVYAPNVTAGKMVDSLAVIARVMKSGDTNEFDGPEYTSADEDVFFEISGIVERYMLSALNEKDFTAMCEMFASANVSDDKRKEAVDYVRAELISPNLQYIEGAVRAEFRKHFNVADDSMDALFEPNANNPDKLSIFSQGIQAGTRMGVRKTSDTNFRTMVDVAFSKGLGRVMLGDAFTSPITNGFDGAGVSDDIMIELYTAGFGGSESSRFSDAVRGVQRAKLTEEPIMDNLPDDLVYGVLAQAFTKATGYKIAGVSTRYGGTNKIADGYTGWYIEKDGEGPEFISPPMPVKEAMTAMRKMMEFIRTCGESTSKNGFHVSVSCKGKKLDDYDVFKLMLFLGDRYLLDMFKRTGNQYTDEQTDKFAKALYSELDYDGDIADDKFDAKMAAMFSNTKKFNNIMLTNGSVTSKYRAFNLVKLLENPENPYIEFRIMGNEGYENKSTDIANTMLRYAFVIDLATNPETEKAEYHKKAYSFWQGLRPYFTTKPAPVSTKRPIPALPVWNITGKYHGEEFVLVPKAIVETAKNSFVGAYGTILEGLAAGKMTKPDYDDVYKGLVYAILYFVKRGTLNAVEKDMFRTYIQYALFNRTTRVTERDHMKAGGRCAQWFENMMDIHQKSTRTHEETLAVMKDDNRDYAYIIDIMEVIGVTTDDFGKDGETVVHLYNVHEWRMPENLNKLLKYLQMDKGYTL
jgi:hypothetical protein